MSQATLVSTLEKQTVNFSVANPSATSNLSLPLYQGAGFRADFSTWSLLQDGGFMKFNLALDTAIPVMWEMTVCASLVNGVSNNPISITVNGNKFVNSYSDHNCGFHTVQWTIPANLLQAGNNEVIVSLDQTASTQLFIQAVTVDQAVLTTQTIDLSIPNPSATANFSIPLYQGAGYRADFRTWSLLVIGGFIDFNVELSNPVDVTLSFAIASALVNGVADSPATVYVNGASFWSINPKNSNFETISNTIPFTMLKAGSNLIQIKLDTSGTGQLFINSATVTAE